ncbi:PREDICTED: disease resistance protein RML1B-like isoform X1 [Tarenaya hassleriana]|uniref:disease resistance protein RML1B-like isoform X1 n=1 Tax=Tarenaya hassleriana TaxID=28532 RepID=UPI0008FD2495|nr:PREDICTED: disease resistance protein RML1B-like isoform X1 [Tarenaya hassleriana]
MPKEQKEIWSKALTFAANIKGEHSKRWDNEAKMIERIASDISAKLNDTPPRDFDGLVGMEAHLEKLSSMLSQDPDEVKMVGIWGPPGIGKTTIARALFDKICGDFQSCIFMENVKGMYGRIDLDDHGLKMRLQKQFLSEIFDQKNTRVKHLGIAKERLKERRVLVVLDDVDHVEQLNALANQSEWFGSGSRIIVTTEDKQVLEAQWTNFTYKVGFPSEQQALEILCRYAFGQSIPLDGFKDLAIEVAKIGGNLPLGLRVLGSSLCGKSIDEWKQTMSRLRTSLDGRIERILRTAYNDLHEKDKAIFLHIACMFNGEKKDLIVHLLDKSRLEVSLGLLNLEKKSLIDISTDKCIVMHHLLQQMGRKVVSSKKLKKRQFLLKAEEILDVLTHNKGTGAILGIALDISELQHELVISATTFQGLYNLMFLRIYDNGTDRNNKLHLPQGMVYLPNTLRLMYWSAYPLATLPSSFHPEFLVKFSMPHSKLEQLWQGIQPLGSLKLMDLSFSKKLKEIPDLSKAINIEKLDISQCESLVTLHSSICELHQLKDLIMWGCSKIEYVPTNINLTSLDSLYMSGCSSLRSIPNMSTNVKYLSLGKMSHTFWSHFAASSISRNTFSQTLKSIQVLRLSYNNFVSIPDCIKELSELRYLFLKNCRNLIELPELPSSLVVLFAENCASLRTISNPFQNSNMVLDFGNCLRLEPEAREIILNSSCEYAFLPGENVPTYFTRQVRGSSLTIHLGQRPLSSFSRFKACVVLASGEGVYDGVMSCSLVARDSGLVFKHELWMRYPYELLGDHLCMFDLVFTSEDNDLEAERCYGDALIQFSCTPYNIIGCGVRF